MQLLMYVGNDLIDTVNLNEQQLSQPGYLGKFKRALKDKHQSLILESAQSPEFLVVQLQAARTAAKNETKEPKEADCPFTRRGSIR